MSKVRLLTSDKIRPRAQLEESVFGKAEFVDTSGQDESTELLAERYQKSWRQLEQIVFSARQVLLCLMGTGWRPDSPQQGVSLSFFNKMVRHGASMLKICPEPIGSVGEFDRDSAAAISRVIYENYHVLFYCCFERISAEEWDARNTLLGLRDLVARQQLWATASEEPISGQVIEKIDQLRKELKENAFFKALPDKRQSHLLLGYKAMYLTAEEIDVRLGNDKQKPATLYKILSHSVHTTPGALKNYEGNDVSEVEMRADLELSTLALNFGGYYLNRSTLEMKVLIPSWSAHSLQAFDTYKKLEQRNSENERLSKERKARRQAAGNSFP